MVDRGPQDRLTNQKTPEFATRKVGPTENGIIINVSSLLKCRPTKPRCWLYIIRGQIQGVGGDSVVRASGLEISLRLPFSISISTIHGSFQAQFQCIHLFCFLYIRVSSFEFSFSPIQFLNLSFDSIYAVASVYGFPFLSIFLCICLFGLSKYVEWWSH